MSSVWDEAGRELSEDVRLFVHPEAEAELEEAGIPFTSAQQEEARLLLDGASTPIWIAVLPLAAQDARASVEDLANLVRQDGSYVALLSNGGADAVSTILSDARSTAVSVSNIAEDMPELIDGIVERYESMADTADGGASGAGGNGTGTSEPDGGGGLLPLAILAAAGGGGFLLYRRNKRNRERVQLEQVRGALDEDITAYGERLSELDLDVQADSKVPIEARHEYGRALDLYENAKLYADRAEKPMDLKAVTNALEEGRWLLGCVDARMKNEPLPERRPPCFFDPRHGPSVDDVLWAPPGGVNRTVPVCAADATRIRDGENPDTRMVTVDGERRPYWDAGPAYGAWAAGYYGAVLPAMMVGTMLGTTMTAPLAYGAADAGAGADGGGGDFGGGFGGGGGGDFGGGFGDGGGGGDFGGGFGDFGGF
ncbi:hypothetical protein [Phytoactinopolyspora halotolerans]|uniref:Uncharacterized protein n=1 Tax=Phytoactinopolyspora halotolerans TaxID=1981512 RepID=A0A6L9S3I4_9ACTN|nr:hypothetical protein [Phytoactinopolyspora halotolerans]NED99725.1 hypothetical protein [Phytoactinopolyspora halotolerans]